MKNIYIPSTNSEILHAILHSNKNSSGQENTIVIDHRNKTIDIEELKKYFQEVVVTNTLYVPDIHRQINIFSETEYNKKILYTTNKRVILDYIRRNSIFDICTEGYSSFANYKHYTRRSLFSLYPKEEQALIDSKVLELKSEFINNIITDFEVDNQKEKVEKFNVKDELNILSIQEIESIIKVFNIDKLNIEENSSLFIIQAIEDEYIKPSKFSQIYLHKCNQINRSMTSLVKGKKLYIAKENQFAPSKTEFLHSNIEEIDSSIPVKLLPYIINRNFNEIMSINYDIEPYVGKKLFYGSNNIKKIDELYNVYFMIKILSENRDITRYNLVLDNNDYLPLVSFLLKYFDINIEIQNAFNENSIYLVFDKIKKEILDDILIKNILFFDINNIIYNENKDQISYKIIEDKIHEESVNINPKIPVTDTKKTTFLFYKIDNAELKEFISNYSFEEETDFRTITSNIDESKKERYEKFISSKRVLINATNSPFHFLSAIVLKNKYHTDDYIVINKQDEKKIFSESTSNISTSFINKKFIYPYDLKYYDSIYLFYPEAYYGVIFAEMNVPFYYGEDGNGCIKIIHDDVEKYINLNAPAVKNIITRANDIGILSLKDKNIKGIVGNKFFMPETAVNNHKIIDINLYEDITKINEIDKEKLLSIYNLKGKINQNKNSVLILDQPLKWNTVPFYLTLIDYLYKDNDLFIKLHPRSTFNTTTQYGNIKKLSGMPMELIHSMIENKFEDTLTMFSSAGNSYKYYSENLYMFGINQIPVIIIHKINFIFTFASKNNITELNVNNDDKYIVVYEIFSKKYDIKLIFNKSNGEIKLLDKEEEKNLNKNYNYTFFLTDFDNLDVKKLTFVNYKIKTILKKEIFNLNYYSNDERVKNFKYEYYLNNGEGYIYLLKDELVPYIVDINNKLTGIEELKKTRLYEYIPLLSLLSKVENKIKIQTYFKKEDSLFLSSKELQENTSILNLELPNFICDTFPDVVIKNEVDLQVFLDKNINILIKNIDRTYIFLITSVFLLNDKKIITYDILEKIVEVIFLSEDYSHLYIDVNLIEVYINFFKDSKEEEAVKDIYLKINKLEKNILNDLNDLNEVIKNLYEKINKLREEYYLENNVKKELVFKEKNKKLFSAMKYLEIENVLSHSFYNESKYYLVDMYLEFLWSTAKTKQLIKLIEFIKDNKIEIINNKTKNFIDAVNISGENDYTISFKSPILQNFQNTISNDFTLFNSEFRKIIGLVWTRNVYESNIRSYLIKNLNNLANEDLLDSEVIFLISKILLNHTSESNIFMSSYLIDLFLKSKNKSKYINQYKVLLENFKVREYENLKEKFIEWEEYFY